MSKIPVLPLLVTLLFASASSASVSVSTVNDLYQHMEKQSPKGKAEVLASLPEELKTNFVLVRNSRSRQRGTPALPRVVHFTKSADLVVTSSGHDYSQDRAGFDLEVMELDRKTGRWIFSTISFDQNGLMGFQKNIRMCMNCHGAQPRPIWGDYVRWPTAYGGSMTTPEQMEGQELADFDSFAASAPTHEAYRHLKFRRLVNRFQLVDTTYEHPNTVFTARLGVRTAEALHLKMKTSPDYARNAAVFAARALDCAVPSRVDKRVDASYATRMKADSKFNSRWSPYATPKDTMSLAIRLLDLDPTVDFELAEFPARSAQRESMDLQNPWNQGTDHLHALTAFPVFLEIWKTDTELQKAFASVRSTIEALEKDSFGATNDRLAALDAAVTAKEYQATLFPSLHFNVWKDATQRQAACDAFVKRAL